VKVERHKKIQYRSSFLARKWRYVSAAIQTQARAFAVAPGRIGQRWQKERQGNNAAGAAAAVMLTLMEPVKQNAPARDLARANCEVCLPDARQPRIP